MGKTKSFGKIELEDVKNAYKKVKRNGGAAGIDGQTIEKFEENLESNLYKLWNRMASGCYFPSAVKRVEIPKDDGKTRPLGIPTVADRIAQTVVKDKLEPMLEKIFHKDSYGYRPNKSAIVAIGVARERCWEYDWVIDLDIKGYFDNINHELLMKAVEKHTDETWILKYTKRMIEAEVAMPNGERIKTGKGTPQGGVISPLLANLFLHYTFDKWVEKNELNIKFERYADDIVCHCKTKEEADRLLELIKERMEECYLQLHPEKSKIVYCKDNRRKEEYKENKINFLGYTFMARDVQSHKGERFLGYIPAMSDKAKKKFKQKIRDCKIIKVYETRIEDIAEKINPILRGVINYFKHYYKTEMKDIFYYMDKTLERWAMRKYKSLKGKKTAAAEFIKRIKKRQPEMFEHWKFQIAK